MADRVSASITIGGTLSAALLPDLLAAIENERLSTDWDGEPFTPDQLVPNEPLALMAHEVAWGHIGELEVFCIEQGLPFARWSGAYLGNGARNAWCSAQAASLYPMPLMRTIPS